MYRNKLRTVKKGFIMIYTLIIGLLCLLVALYCLEFHYSNKTNATLFEKNLCKTPILYNSKEYLLTKLKTLIVEKTSDFTEGGIKVFFQSNAIENITYNHCYLKYDSINNCIIMFSYVDEYFHREDYYDCKVIDSNINFVYKCTIFKEGRSKQ
jgi:hypothetical protein